LIFVLNEVIRSDRLIKSYIPTSGSLLQSINIPKQLVHLIWVIPGHESLRLYHIHLIEVTIEECGFDVHLPNLIIIVCCNSQYNSNGF
ncbi:unnamed protein product, partial [Musa textilis]